MLVLGDVVLNLAGLVLLAVWEVQFVHLFFVLVFSLRGLAHYRS